MSSPVGVLEPGVRRAAWNAGEQRFEAASRIGQLRMVAQSTGSTDAGPKVHPHARRRLHRRVVRTRRTRNVHAESGRQSRSAAHMRIDACIRRIRARSTSPLAVAWAGKNEDTAVGVSVLGDTGRSIRCNAHPSTCPNSSGEQGLPPRSPRRTRAPTRRIDARGEHRRKGLGRRAESEPHGRRPGRPDIASGRRWCRSGKRASPIHRRRARRIG